MARRVLRQLRPGVAPGATAIVALAVSLAGAAVDRRSLDKLVADLAPPIGVDGPTGHVVVEPGRRDGELRIRLILSNDTPGAQRTWRIRPTTAAAAVPTAEASVRVNARGHAVAVVDVAAHALPADVPLVVEILDPADDATVLARGALA
jgi:hypothetical protein